MPEFIVHNRTSCLARQGEMYANEASGAMTVLVIFVRTIRLKRQSPLNRKSVSSMSSTEFPWWCTSNSHTMTSIIKRYEYQTVIIPPSAIFFLTPERLLWQALGRVGLEMSCKSVRAISHSFLLNVSPYPVVIFGRVYQKAQATSTA
jgi:hypothetical protein